ncbi:MAG: 3,5-nucleoside bisphosphate phosphatase [Chloroflexia bacterium]|jgi:predicted metal-dependent phosphoesterase TrpH|nr:3,5-nucleoside bisphosphate phosphatase [Chloroflexia bacterium]
MSNTQRYPNSSGRLSSVTIPADGYVDLHMHTTASDGRFTPEELAKAAHELGLAVIALADHDRVDNVLPLQREAARYGLHVIPAVEVSCVWGEVQYHMLVYNVDLTDQSVVGPLNEARDKYAEICAKGIEELAKQGKPIDPAVLAICTRGQPIAPYHVFQALIKHEYAPNMKEAHELAKTVGVDFLPQTDMRDMIQRARRSGAIPILAHPARAEPGFNPPGDATLREMIEAGLMGFEVWHPFHSSYDTAYYMKLCQDQHLLMSSGSDTHSPQDPRRRLTKWPARHVSWLLAACGVSLES